MSVVVFAGPTIDPETVQSHCACTCLPPAARGDIHRAALRKPRAIGLVDGYFHGVPSVWHKEILWAMSEGIHVFGSSSMGALRAAELHQFGMRGVGSIFEQYRSGALQDDDEVAVLHAPEPLRFAPLSEAMVNIRATLARAVDEDVVAASSGESLCRAAKEMSYRERDWRSLLDSATAGALPASERDALRAWLPRGRIDLKRADAIALLGAMRQFIDGEPVPMRVGYAFEWTHLWDSLFREVAPAEGPADAADPGVERERLLDELRLDPERFGQVRRGALLRLLASKEARSRQLVDRGRLRAGLTHFREPRGLYDRARLDDWMRRNAVDEAGLERLVEEEAQIEALADLAAGELAAGMVSELRMRGDYAALLARARSKQRALAGVAAGAPPGGVGDLSSQQVATWFFENRLGRDAPPDLDGVARGLGLDGRDSLALVLTRELLYSCAKIES